MILLMILSSSVITSCKTQLPLRQQLYAKLKTTDSIMDNRILKNFSKLDSPADTLLNSKLKSIDQLATQVKNKRIRADLQLYTALANKVILLHQDPRINFEALGPLLDSYTRTSVVLYGRLR